MNILDKAEKMYKKKGVRNAVTCAAVIVSALLQSFVIQTFIRPAELLSGGFTGIAILVDMAASKFGMSFPTSLGMLVFNLPVAALCSRSISKRFTAFSLLQVCTSSIFLQIFHFSPLFDDVVLNVVFGGFLLGISIVVALKGNASTGGTDFIALYVSNKTGRSIWGEVFVGNCVLFCIFGMKEYVSAFRHGISALDAIGGYSRKKMFVLHTVISSYELDDVIRLMREVDPHVIINVFKTDQFFGSFYRAPMD